jgi:hypothetical protein
MHEDTADRGNRATIELVRNFQAITDPQVRKAISSLVKSLSGQPLDPPDYVNNRERMAKPLS